MFGAAAYVHGSACEASSEASKDIGRAPTVQLVRQGVGNRLWFDARLKINAFCEKLIEELSEGVHAGQCNKTVSSP